MFRYVKSNKQSARELKNTIVKAVGFMNRDVKAPLGIKVNTMSSTPKSVTSNTSVGAGNAGILGG